MNIEEFCKKYNLGNVINITKLTGGLMHKMFKVETDKGIYAIKILNSEVMLRDNAYDNFVVSEKISNFAKDNGINVSNALIINNNFINKHNNDYYMVFNYVEGKTLTDKEITIQHCKKIGNVLAQIHNLDYKKIGLEGKIKKEEYNVDWESYMNNENFNKMPYKDKYLKNYIKYDSLLKRCIAIYNESNNTISICHRDLDPKNVMWNNNEPIIIDWESASLSNPHRELIETAISWSGFLSNEFSIEKFKSLIKEYIKIKTTKYDSDSMIYSNLISKFWWLDYNIKRSLGIITNDNEEIILGQLEVNKTIDEINRYLKLIDVMNEAIKGVIYE